MTGLISWGGQTFSSAAFAVEGLDTDSDSTIDKYKLAIKHSQTDTNTSLSSENWETIEISTAGVVNWSTVKWGMRHRMKLILIRI